METPQELPPEDFRFVCTRSTRWSDEDNQGVVNNAVYLTLLEEARHAYFGALGLLEDNRFPFLLAQTNIVFLRPVRGGQALEVCVRTLRLGRTSLEQAYAIRSASSGLIHARAQARLVSYDPASGQKRPMDEGFRSAVSRHCSRSGDLGRDGEIPAS